MRVDNNGLEVNFLTPNDTNKYRYDMGELVDLVGKTITGVGLMEFDQFIGNGNDVFYTLLLKDMETGQEQLLTILRDDEGNGAGSFSTEYVGSRTSHVIRKTTKEWQELVANEPDITAELKFLNED